MPSRHLLACLLALLCCGWSQHCLAQLQRCTAADGSMVYSDRKCTDIGAVDRLPRAAPGAGTSGRMYQRGCTRTVQDLIYEITGAIDAHDVNRLAGIYHWVGMSTRTAYAVMGQLDRIAQRPLVDVQPVYPRPPPILAEDGTVLDDNLDGFYPVAATGKPPYALQVEQTIGRSATPSRTQFGLRRHLGCVWISL